VGVQTQFPAIFSCRNQSQSNGSPSGGSDIGAAPISIIIHNRFFIQGRETQYIYNTAYCSRNFVYIYVNM
jgi:hypothetical protein